MAVRTSLQDGVASVVLDRPDRRNAIDPEMLDGLVEALNEIGADPTCGVVVIRGEGRGFCSGVDTESSFFPLGQQDRPPLSVVRSLERQHELIRVVAGLPQVTLALVHGAAIGGAGFGLALACDLRFAATDAYFGLIVGRTLPAIQDFGVMWFLNRLVGYSRALELLYETDWLEAERAAELGIVNRVLPGETLLSEGYAYAERLARGPAFSLRLGKRAVKLAARSVLSDQLAFEGVANGMLLPSEEMQIWLNASARGETPSYEALEERYRRFDR